MADQPSSKPSFSPGRRVAIAFDLLVRTAVVLAVVAMLNYIGGRYFHRFYLSSQTRVELSSRTLTVLHTITNQVKVTLYYDKSDPLYTAAINFCHGFGVGVFRVLRAVDARKSSQPLFCLPNPMPTRNAALTAFIQWAKADPNRLTQPPEDGLAAFLSQQYPCDRNR